MMRDAHRCWSAAAAFSIAGGADLPSFSSTSLTLLGEIAHSETVLPVIAACVPHSRRRKTSEQHAKSAVFASGPVTSRVEVMWCQEIDSG